MKNNLQKIISGISGYEKQGEQGAKNDSYYQCKSRQEKIEFVKDFSRNYEYENLDEINDADAEKIVNLLDYKGCSEAEWFHLYVNI